jgi:hypothetical protein
MLADTHLSLNVVNTFCGISVILISLIAALYHRCDIRASFIFPLGDNYYIGDIRYYRYIGYMETLERIDILDWRFLGLDAVLKIVSNFLVCASKDSERRGGIKPQSPSTPFSTV